MANPLHSDGFDAIAAWDVERPPVTPHGSAEDVFEQLAPTVAGPLVARLVPLAPSSGGGLSAVDIYRDAGSMTLGRSRQLVVECRIDVASVSAQHCVLSVNPASRKVTIRDVSTNGTFINGARLDKEAEVELQSGDRVSLNNPEKAAEAGTALVEFIFQRVTNEVITGVLEEELTCPVCKCLYVRPCSAVPCLHVFCAGCISRWLDAGNKTCIQCRANVWEVRPANKIQNCVEEFLKANPELNHSTEDVAERVAYDNIPAAGRKVQKRPREEDSDASEESVNDSEDADDMSDQSQSTVPVYDRNQYGHTRSTGGCQHCQNASPVDGFRCPPDGLHVVCPRCCRNFPYRPLCSRPQTCQICNASYCNLYYEGEGGCPSGYGGLTRLSQYNAPSSLPQQAFGGNTVERSILSRYLSTKGISVETVWRDCMEKLESEEWIPDIPCVDGALTPDSPLCDSCIDRVFAALLFHYRRAVPSHELPERVTKRPNCWYGISCRTQFHKPEHANRYNHVCYQEKRKE